MTIYAGGTKVSVAQSRAEIETMLKRYGAVSYGCGWDRKGASIVFALEGRHVKFVLPLPQPDDASITHDGRGKTRSKDAAHRAWDHSCRQKWRALALVIKAKLEAVTSEITTFDEEFLAHIVLPNGGTVADVAIPRIVYAYENGQMPALLLGHGMERRS